MKKQLLILFIIFSACTSSLDKANDLGNTDLELSLVDLSAVIEPLLNKEVQGYVVISKAALEYSSISHARADSSAPKSIVEIDVERLDHHRPGNIKDERYYNWGSPLICRKVVKDYGDIVEVLTLDPDEDPEKLGHGTRGADYLYELRTFVRKKDLVPVLDSTFEIEYADKTFIKLGAGVAVGIPWGSDERNRAVSIQHLHFGCSVPDSLIALSYQPTNTRLEELNEKKMLDENALLVMNGKDFGLATEIRDDRLRTPVSIRKIGQKHLVELVENGLTLGLLTDLELVKTYIPNIERPVLSNKFATPPKWYYRIPEGTAVYWEDGRLAGEVRQYFGHHSKTGPGDSTYCKIMDELFENMPICFKLKDIEVHENA